MINHLNASHFYVNNKRQLCNKIPNNSFVMFTSPSCIYCTRLIPSFTKLSESLRGCVFAIMDVEQNKRHVLQLASSSSTPIEYVPYVVLYANGVPVKQFVPSEENPMENYKLMRTFLIKETNRHNNVSSTQINNTSANSSDIRGGKGRGTEQNNDTIPLYSIGIPGNRNSKNKRGVCYLKSFNAYTVDDRRL